MSETHVVALEMLDRGERADRAREELDRELGDAVVSQPDDAGVFEVSVEADSAEDALRKVWDALAAAGADDHIVFLEHPELPDHWRCEDGGTGAI